MLVGKVGKMVSDKDEDDWVSDINLFRISNRKEGGIRGYERCHLLLLRKIIMEVYRNQFQKFLNSQENNGQGFVIWI